MKAFVSSKRVYCQMQTNKHTGPEETQEIKRDRLLCSARLLRFLLTYVERTVRVRPSVRELALTKRRKNAKTPISVRGVP